MIWVFRKGLILIIIIFEIDIIYITNILSSKLYIITTKSFLSNIFIYYIMGRVFIVI